MKRTTWLCVAFLIMPVGSAFSEAVPDAPAIHKKVQQALDWELPANECLPPKAPGLRKEVNDDEGGTRTEWDVDSYTLERYERKVQRWKNCVDKYKAGLGKDFETLKNSARFGLTEQQGNIILNKMKLIQEVLSSADGCQPTGYQPHPCPPNRGD